MSLVAVRMLVSRCFLGVAEERHGGTGGAQVEDESMVGSTGMAVSEHQFLCLRRKTAWISEFVQLGG